MEMHTSVIIADSAEEFCAKLSAALQRTEGFQVLGTATDGEQTIRLVTERKPAILVLDMMLAKKDGAIDAFFYASVTTKYLQAALEAL